MRVNVLAPSPAAKKKQSFGFVDPKDKKQMLIFIPPSFHCRYAPLSLPLRDVPLQLSLEPILNKLPRKKKFKNAKAMKISEKMRQFSNLQFNWVILVNEQLLTDVPDFKTARELVFKIYHRMERTKSGQVRFAEKYQANTKCGDLTNTWIFANDYFSVGGWLTWQEAIADLESWKTNNTGSLFS